MNTIDWPADLKAQIARRNVVIFVGAGASMSSRNSQNQAPPSWDQLLEKLAPEFCRTAEDKLELALLKERKDPLLTAEFIRHRVNQSGDLSHYMDRLEELCDGPTGDRFKPSELHDAIVDLDAPLVITTNFDKILERALDDGWKTFHYNDQGLDSLIRHGKNVLLKLHGGLDPSSSPILSQSEYTNLRSSGSNTLEVLKAIFLTRMVLFIGYGFNDPELKYLMETLFGVAGRQPGHVMVLNGDIKQYQHEMFRRVYGLHVRTYEQGQHQILRESLNELKAQSIHYSTQ